MSKTKFRCAAVISTVLTCALLLAVASQAPSTLRMTVDQGRDEVHAGGIITGVADDDGGMVEVRMYIDGELVEEDIVMEDGQNDFAFDVPEDAEGKLVTIQAVTPEGDTVERTFRVRPKRV
ncbi:MAG: hypothetical protein ABFS86_05890 [Planctomycetota bacterium]